MNRLSQNPILRFCDKGSRVLVNRINTMIQPIVDKDAPASLSKFAVAAMTTKVVELLPLFFTFEAVHKEGILRCVIVSHESKGFGPSSARV